MDGIFGWSVIAAAVVMVAHYRPRSHDSIALCAMCAAGGVLAIAVSPDGPPVVELFRGAALVVLLVLAFFQLRGERAPAAERQAKACTNAARRAG